MTALAPILESFFLRRLMGQRRASQNTVSSYRDSFRLLLHYAKEETAQRTVASHQSQGCGARLACP